MNKRPRYANILIALAVAGLLLFLFRMNLNNQEPGDKYSEVMTHF